MVFTCICMRRPDGTIDPTEFSRGVRRPTTFCAYMSLFLLSTSLSLAFSVYLSLTIVLCTRVISSSCVTFSVSRAHSFTLVPAPARVRARFQHCLVRTPHRIVVGARSRRPACACINTTPACCNNERARARGH
jgi:hypothetical protein